MTRSSVIRSISFCLAFFSCSLANAFTMLTASNQGTSAANHNVLVATSATVGGLNFFAAICTGSASSPAGYCMVFDSLTVPVDGAVTPKLCVAIPAAVPATGATAAPSQGVATASGNSGMAFVKGIVVTFSSGADCSTKTTTAGDSVFVETTYVNNFGP